MSAELPVPEADLEARWVTAGARFKRAQVKHFLISVAAPTALTIAGLIWLPAAAFGWFGAFLALAMWTLVGGLGVSVGYHRHFSHRSFNCSNRVRYMLGAFASMAGQGSVIYWTALHRRHHSFADRRGDPHTPSAAAQGSTSSWRSFLQGHIGWTLGHDVPKVSRYARDLLGDPVATALSKHYRLWFAVGILFPAVIGFAYWGGWQGLVYGAFWGGVLRIALGHHIIWSINSVCHRVGSRPHQTPDNSTNVALLSLISFGESWHNNHHNSPTSARFGSGWQFDLGWMFIRGLKLFDSMLVVRKP